MPVSSFRLLSFRRAAYCHLPACARFLSYLRSSARSPILPGLRPPSCRTLVPYCRLPICRTLPICRLLLSYRPHLPCRTVRLYCPTLPCRPLRPCCLILSCRLLRLCCLSCRLLRPCCLILFCCPLPACRCLPAFSVQLPSSASFPPYHCHHDPYIRTPVLLSCTAALLRAKRRSLRRSSPETRQPVHVRSQIILSHSSTFHTTLSRKVTAPHLTVM